MMAWCLDLFIINGMRVFYEEREGEVGELLNQVKTNGAAGWR